MRAVTLLRIAPAGVMLALGLAACGSAPPPGHAASGAPAGNTPAGSAAASAPVSSPAAGAGTAIPAPAHTVVVVMENQSYRGIIGNPQAGYLNRLARRGALFTSSWAVTHPSQPNYLDLFSGSDHGVTDDSCPHTLTGPNLGADLIAAHRSFAGYAEDLPVTGSVVCGVGEYARKHVPWANFPSVPRADSRSFAAFGAHGYAALPTVSFVIPNLCDDMHDCPVATGDRWLQQHISGYARWAMTHGSLLIVTWDEGSGDNHIATIFAGQQVRPGRYAQRLTHFGVLRTIEQAYGLRRDGAAAAATPVRYIWK